MSDPELEAKLAKLKRSRAVYKGFVTKLSSRITANLAEKELSVIAISDTINEFELQLGKYDAADQEYLACFDEGEELENEIQLSEEFRYEVRAPLVEAKKVLHALEESKPPSIASGVSNVSLSSNQVSVKLPKLELPHFDGKYTEWQTFWEHFETHIHHNDDVPVISKFSYLVSLLDGDAKQVIKGYSHTESNYKHALEVLKDRFGDKEKIVVLLLVKVFRVVYKQYK